MTLIKIKLYCHLTFLKAFRSESKRLIDIELLQIVHIFRYRNTFDNKQYKHFEFTPFDNRFRFHNQLAHFYTFVASPTRNRIICT
jgi:hypothetical protein